MTARLHLHIRLDRCNMMKVTHYCEALEVLQKHCVELIIRLASFYINIISQIYNLSNS